MMSLLSSVPALVGLELSGSSYSTMADSGPVSPAWWNRLRYANHGWRTGYHTSPNIPSLNALFMDFDGDWA